VHPKAVKRNLIPRTRLQDIVPCNNFDLDYR